MDNRFKDFTEQEKRMFQKKNLNRKMSDLSGKKEKNIKFHT